MHPQRLGFLEDLAEFGRTNDQRVTQRSEKLLNITPDTGPFLAFLIKVTQARSVLEIGTSNGYSTIWLADALEATACHVTTIESEAAKVTQARDNFRQAGVATRITIPTALTLFF